MQVQQLLLVEVTRRILSLLNPCYHIGDVLVDGVSQGAIPSYTFNGVTSGHTISATFVNNGSNTITASAGTGGSISPNGGTSVPCGGSPSLYYYHGCLS
jgi:hypothetical protein